jgi:glutamyl endopeptidase
VVVLYSEFPTGASGTCTGTLVGPRSVLSAAHCVYDHEAGGWATEVIFLPGMTSKDERPHGTYTWKRADVVQGFIDNFQDTYGSLLEWDLAVVMLAEPAGERLGYLPLKADDTSFSQAIIYGYPWDKADGTMWTDSCQIAPGDRYPAYLLHDCEAPGVSGAPLIDKVARKPSYARSTSLPTR